MIIFLNGTSSCGKSSIAKALQQLYPSPLLAIGIDSFLQMMPQQYLYFGEKADEGFRFIQEHDEEGPITNIIAGEFGNKMIETVPKVIDTILQDGYDIIIDEVLFEDESLKQYVKQFRSYQVYFIGVHCELKTINEREISRGNRALGLGRRQFDIVHGPTRFYDFEVDTTSQSPDECAKKIIAFIEQTPAPDGFNKLYKQFFDTLE